MFATTSPLLPLLQGATEESEGIVVTREFEQTFEQIRVEDDHQDPCQLLETVLDTDTSTLKCPNEISVQYWICRTKKKLAHNAARFWMQRIPLCMLQSCKSFLAGFDRQMHFFLSPTLWYDFWTFVSGIVLYASILRCLESSLACKILLFSTCGEFFALIKQGHVCFSPQQSGRRFSLVFVFLFFLKCILTCVLFFVDWSDLMGIGGSLAFSALFICCLQVYLSQIYHLVVQPSKHNSPATRREVRDPEKTFDVDVESAAFNLKLGRQYLRDGSLATLQSEFDCKLYTLIRLSNLRNHKKEEIPVDKFGRLHEVSSALELPDESWEMVVLKSYLPELEIKLDAIFSSYHLDLKYDPTEPSREDVELLFIAAKNSKLPTERGEMVEDAKRYYTAAKILRIDAFSSRAMAMIREDSWPVAAAYYSHLLR